MCKIKMRSYDDKYWRDELGYTKDLSKEEAEQISQRDNLAEYSISRLNGLCSRFEFGYDGWGHNDPPLKEGEVHIPHYVEEQITGLLHDILSITDEKNNKIYSSNNYKVKITVSDIVWSVKDKK